MKRQNVASADAITFGTEREVVRFFVLATPSILGGVFFMGA
jgi:hypothetical protein